MKYLTYNYLKWRFYPYFTRLFYFNCRYIIYMRRRFNKVIALPILILTSPLMLVRWLLCEIYDCAIGGGIAKRKIHSDLSRKFEHEIAMVSIAKNEGPYLKEWIEYHKLVGFTKFYFYDNESTDNTREILAPYIASGLVEYTLIPGVGKQLDAYNEAIRLHKQSCRWMAFIDLDEYIAPAEPFKSIAEILNEQTAKHGGCAAGMLINWCLYGSSHLEKTPKGLITENFTHHAEQSFWGNHLGKTICNPRLVNYYVSPHYPYYWIGAYSISGSGAVKTNDWKVKPADWSVVRLNHYHTKSYEQYLQKISRGMGDRPNEYVAAGFSHYDKNDVEDPSMLVYQRRLHEALGNS